MSAPAEQKVESINVSGEMEATVYIGPHILGSNCACVHSWFLLAEKLIEIGEARIKRLNEQV